MSNIIVALATPPGRSGIGMIRLSGDGALQCAGRLCGEPGLRPRPRHASLKTLFDIETGDPIDEAVIVYFQGPHSFTGEDVIEISCHGSPVLLRQVIDACLTLGARMAEAGEFTLRAFANGRMNLAEAEAVRDLIDARTAASARQAVRQLRGEFSDQLRPLKDKLLDAIVVLESALEFVEDDLPEMQSVRIRGLLVNVAGEIGRVAATFKAGRLLREGLKVAIAGRPNVGKSSLFNAMLGTERAIVTEIAGTTRDHINETFSVEGVPVSLIDTAGLRNTADTVESIGVERSRRVMADADMVIVVLDGSELITPEDIEILAGLRDLPSVLVVNKIDKVPAGRVAAVVASAREAQKSAAAESEKDNAPLQSIVPVSAAFGTGVEELKLSIIQTSLSDTPGASEITNELDASAPRPHHGSRTADQNIAEGGFLVTDARHHDLLTRAREDILSSINLLDQNASEELTLIGLHNALRYLGQITGETTPEDLLSQIFATFCIGK